MKKFLKNHFPSIIGIFVLCITVASISFAAPAIYTPGQTLTPTCAPGSSPGGIPCTTSILGYDSDGNVETITTADALVGTTGFKIQNSALSEMFKILNNGAVRISGAYTLPTDNGDADQVLTTDGSGGTSWETASGGSGGETIYALKVSLTSAEILSLNSTPKTIIPAPGAGKTIQLLGFSGRLNFVTTAYATNTALRLKYSSQTASGLIANEGSLLSSTSTSIRTGSLSSGPMKENELIDLTVNGGNPTTGDGTLDIYVTYKIIDL